MITTTNYYATIKAIDRSTLPADLKEAADFVDEITEKGKTWEIYGLDKVTKETIDLYFSKLGEFLEQEGKQPSKSTRQTAKTSAPKQTRKAATSSREKVTTSRKSKPSMRIVGRSGEPVERISEELRFIKRFVLLNGKPKSGQQIRTFFNSLQRAMVELRIRKTSPYATEVYEIQDALIAILDKLKGKAIKVVEINPSRLAHLQNLCGKQQLMLSIRFIKSYIGLQGKRIENIQAKNLYNRLGRAINAERITSKDPYFAELTEMLLNLESFVKKNPSGGVLVIPTRSLNGLDGILSGWEDEEDDGYDTPPRNVVMDSLDFVQMNFKTIGFTGKWLDFIGDPSVGFLALVASPAKYGKSILCIEWAAYLARNHGRVLYIAKEEGLDDTLKRKLAQTAHENLKVSDYIPEDLSSYQFIFFDSITMLHIRPSDIEQIKAKYPNKGLIFVSQVNKAGTARGSNEFYHNVDIIIEFPEIGKAVQYGRFNQGGEMYIFNNN